MLNFLNKYGANVHSQNLEDGIIAECVRRIPDINQVCCEIGGNDGLWLSNTRYLLEHGWSGTFVEADYGLWQQCWDTWKQRPDVKCICSRVTEQNVNAFVDDSCDVLSSDTDGADYQIFKGLKAKPKIVIIEIDSSLPPGTPGFNSDGGASYWSGVELGLQKGYFLLCHTGNLVFVDEQYKHLFPEITGHPLLDYEKYFNRGWIKEAA